MNQFQVDSINKGGNEHERITEIGGPEGGGWRRSVQQIITNIANGEQFFVGGVGKRAQVSPWPNQQTGPYLRTHADGQWNNNLLSLPPIPTHYK